MHLVFPPQGIWGQSVNPPLPLYLPPCVTFVVLLKGAGPLSGPSCPVLPLNGRSQLLCACLQPRGGIKLLLRRSLVLLHCPKQDFLLFYVHLH